MLAAQGNIQIKGKFSLKEAIRYIEETSDYTFFYKDSDLKDKSKKEINCSGTIEEVLKNLFKGSGVNYIIKGKEEEIRNILDLLEEKDLTDIVKTCPTILARGKAIEIKNILKLLEEKELLDLVNSCPSILAQGKAKKIKEILEKLDTINGNIKNIPLGLINDYEKMNDIIDLKSEDVSEEEFKYNLKNHLKLIGEYNKFYTKSDLIELSNKLNISYDELLSNIFEYRDVINKTLELQKYIWIGDSFSLTSELLNEYSKEIIDIVDLVTKSFIKKTKFNYDEVYDFIMDILINRAGAFFINYGKTDSLKPTLCKYLLKYCKVLYSKDNFIDLSKIQNLNKYSINDELNDDFISSYSYLTEEEQYFLTRMSKHIEEQENYLELLSEEFCITIDEVIEYIENIKNKISKNDGNIKIKKYTKEES